MPNKDIIAKINNTIGEKKYTLDNIDDLLEPNPDPEQESKMKDSKMKCSILLEMLMRNNDIKGPDKWLLSEEQINIIKERLKLKN